MPTAEQYWNNPASSKGTALLAAKYLPKTAAGSYAAGFKPMGGVSGAGIGIGTEIAGAYLKPKEDQPIFGGVHGDLIDRYTRRLQTAGPGILGGAVRGAGQGAQYGGWYGAAAGAVAGGIYGVAKKHATTAYSDFKPEDARTSITDAYSKYLGRAPEEGVVDTYLANQGWKPGDKGVGQYSMFGMLDSIKDSPEAAQYAGINTAPTNTLMNTYKPAGINVPGYFANNPKAMEIINRMNQRNQVNA